MQIRFAHTADWHPRSMGTIGGKLQIDPESGLSQTLTDFRLSLAWMIQTMKNQETELLLVAGDVFDTHKPSMDELSTVMEFFTVCIQNDIKVVVISGNHDIAQSGQMASALKPSQYLPGLYVIERPQSLKLNVQGNVVRIDCLPYPSRGRLLAHRLGDGLETPEAINQTMNEHLLAILQHFEMKQKPEKYTDQDPGMEILLAHGSVDMAKVNDQPRSLAHDILIPLQEIQENYDYIALGHIHQAQQISAEHARYSGSLLRQGFGEEKEAKGFYCGVFEGKGHCPRLTFFENPFARTYRTLTTQELEPIPEDPATVYRIKDTIQDGEAGLVMPKIQAFLHALPYVQVNVEIEKEDRTRDSEMSNQMDSSQAVDRSLERDGVSEPLLGIVRELHLEITKECEA